MSVFSNMSNKRILAYSAIAIVCVIFIGASIYFEFFYSTDRPIGLLGEVTNETPIEVETEELKQNFNNMFNNSLKKIIIRIMM